ncbi:MAG: peptidoglycan DD-metalloendopeptidase family protein [Oscillospiraceae bacterium]|nr:peptidoglycan DD-metalloendopeptidase family protein [Oscillospiraceae bacterium]
MNLHIQKNGRKGSSKGFYIALGVCLIAVGIAAWTTYDSVVNYAAPEDKSQSEPVQSTAPTNNTISGIYADPESSPQQEVSSVAPEVVSSEPESKPEPKPESKSQQKEEAASAKPAAAEVTSYAYPVGKTVIQKFSADPVYCKTTLDWRAHTGIDLSAEKGEDVKASANGTVTKAYQDDQYGNTLIITHGEVEAWYCGLEKMNVKAGDKVEAGQVIGTVGSVPIEQNEGCHLHFVTKVNDEYVDPLTLLK